MNRHNRASSGNHYRGPLTARTTPPASDRRVTSTAPPRKPLQWHTLAEAAKHCAADDAWAVIDERASSQRTTRPDKRQAPRRRGCGGQPCRRGLRRRLRRLPSRAKPRASTRPASARSRKKVRSDARAIPRYSRTADRRVLSPLRDRSPSIARPARRMVSAACACGAAAVRFGAGGMANEGMFLISFFAY